MHQVRPPIWRYFPGERHLGGKPARMGRKWGQHFLRSESTVEKIVEAAGLSNDDIVLEIGPGEGVLTYKLCAAARQVHAFEIDPELADKLESSEQPNLKVHRGDFLEADLRVLESEAAQGLTVVANLPYYITAPILQVLLWKRPLPVKRAVLMMQEEVAQRVCSPASKQAGALTYFSNAFFAVRYLFKVSPGCFSPPPKVDSAVIEAVPVADAENGSRSRLYERIVATAFRTRRKQLNRSLRGIVPTPQVWLEEAGIDPKRRPETLTVQEFWRLARTCPNCE